MQDAAAAVSDQTPTLRRKARSASAKTKPPAALAPPPASSKPESAAEPKLVRDSYTIPKPEYAALEQLKLRAANLRRPTKKSELLRAGIAALRDMSDKTFLSTLGRIPTLKTGRPKKRATGK
jgi:hypothetical protein